MGKFRGLILASVLALASAPSSAIPFTVEIDPILGVGAWGLFGPTTITPATENTFFSLGGYDNTGSPFDVVAGDYIWGLIGLTVNTLPAYDPSWQISIGNNTIYSNMLSSALISFSFGEKDGGLFVLDGTKFAAAVPEPGTLALLGIGLLGIGLLGLGLSTRRRRQHR